MSAVRISIFKAWNARTARQWVNTYEAVERADPSISDADPLDFVGLADALVTFEQAIHLVPVYFHRYVISTWLPDSDPYDPAALYTHPLSVQGLRALTGTTLELTAEPLQMVALATRNATTGKPGRMMYRGALNESEVEQAGGYSRLFMGSGSWADGFNTAKAGLSAFLLAGAGTTVITLIGGQLNKTVVAGTDSGLAITKVKRTYGPPYHVRFVQELLPSGVTFKQQGNRYFDRAA